MARSWSFQFAVIVTAMLNAPFLGVSVEILDEPRTDKSCYNVGDSGMITLSFSVGDANPFRDLYKVVLRTPDGNILDGSVFIGDCAPDRQMRWNTTRINSNTVVYLKIDMVDMAMFDNTPNITTYIIDIISGQNMARSKKEFSIRVEEECPDSSSTTTSFQSTKQPEETTSKFNVTEFLLRWIPNLDIQEALVRVS